MPALSTLRSSTHNRLIQNLPTLYMKWIELQGTSFFVQGEYRSFPMPFPENPPEYGSTKPREIPGQITKLQELKIGERYQLITSAMPGVSFTLLDVWADDKGVVRIKTEQLGKIPPHSPLRYGTWSTAELGVTATQDGKWNHRNRLFTFPNNLTKQNLKALGI